MDLKIHVKDVVKVFDFVREAVRAICGAIKHFTSYVSNLKPSSVFQRILGRAPPVVTKLRGSKKGGKH